MVQTIDRWQTCSSSTAHFIKYHIWWRGEDVLDRFALSASPASVGVAEPQSPPVVGERFSSYIPFISKIVNLVERGGFEPPKALPTDLQSVPFGRSGTSPTLYPHFLIEYFLLI